MGPFDSVLSLFLCLNHHLHHIHTFLMGPGGCTKWMKVLIMIYVIYKYFLVSVCSVTGYPSACECQSFSALHVKIWGWLCVCKCVWEVHTTGLVVDAAGPCYLPHHWLLRAASSGQIGEISAVVTFHYHGNGLRVTPGKIHTATPIYSLGLTPDQRRRMSE